MNLDLHVHLNFDRRYNIRRYIFTVSFQPLPSRDNSSDGCGKKEQPDGTKYDHKTDAISLSKQMGYFFYIYNNNPYIRRYS